MKLSEGCVVWVRKEGRIFRPGVVGQANDDQSVPVRIMGGKQFRRVPSQDVLAFVLQDPDQAHFEDKVLSQQVIQAIRISRQLRPSLSVRLEDLNGVPKSKNREKKNWKKDFLDSIEDDDGQDEEDKENTNASSKPRVRVKVRLSSVEEEDNEETELTNTMSPTTLTKKKTMPLKEVKPKQQKSKTPKMGEDDDDEEESEYEKLRRKNIQEKEALFARLMSAKKALMASMAPPVKPKSSSAMRRIPRIKVIRRHEPYPTRSRRSLNSEGSSPKTSSEASTPRKYQFFEEYSSDEDENDGEYRSQSRRSHPTRWIRDPNNDFLKAEDVTDAMLDNVADRVSDKVYDQARGTTCHQCRQKTRDTKTVCRSGHCAGTRGFFCGVCLLNRYGQKVREALKDPNWMCPPCLDICNCSICRNRYGKGATGPITYLAHAKGFSNVHDFLMSLKKEKKSAQEELEPITDEIIAGQA